MPAEKQYRDSANAPGRRLEVLHLLGTAQPAGASLVRVFDSLRRQLEPQRYSLHAWFTGADGPLADELRAKGVPVQVLNWPNARSFTGPLRFLRALSGCRFDLVHQHGGGGRNALIRRLLKATRHIPIVLHLHGRVDEWKGTELLRLHRGGADEVVAVSNAVAGCVAGRKARVIYSGITVRNAQPRDGSPRRPSGPVIGSAARLVPVKDLRTLIRATALLLPDFPHLRLEIAGEGPERPKLEGFARQLQIGQAVRFLGWQPDVTPLLSGWDVFAVSSVEESFGLAALEAMAHGLPVVGTRVGGLAELIEDEVSGYLVAPRDAHALACRVRDFLADEARRAEFSLRGIERSRCFSDQRMAAGFRELYEQLTGGR